MSHVHGHRANTATPADDEIPKSDESARMHAM
jgi:hypothetical protein